MKKYFLVLLSILVIVLSGCDKTDPRVEAKGADEVAIFCGVRSYAMFSEKEKTVKAVAECFKGLTFQKSDQEIDILTMMTVCFSKEDKTLTQISVDSNGVFWLGEDAQSYVTESGTFDYEALNQLYMNGDRIDVDTGYSYH